MGPTLTWVATLHVQTRNAATRVTFPQPNTKMARRAFVHNCMLFRPPHGSNGRHPAWVMVCCIRTAARMTEPRHCANACWPAAR
jgi:hypothetical protein